MKIVKFLEELGLLKKGVSQTIKNEAKKTKRWISQNVIRDISYKYIGAYVSKKT